MVNYNCGTCEIRIPHNRPVLFCSLCKDHKHYKCNGLTKNEAWDIIYNNHMEHWTCRDCYDLLFPHNTDTPDTVPNTPTKPVTNNHNITYSCSSCNKPCPSPYSARSIVCIWCDSQCHKKCHKNSLGCISCCNGIIPGYNCDAHQINGSLLYHGNNSKVFDPYNSTVLTNQIGNSSDNEEEAQLWSEISNNLKKCRYISEKSVTFSKNNELKVLSLNVRSLVKGISDIKKNYMDSFEKFDVVFSKREEIILYQV